MDIEKKKELLELKGFIRNFWSMERLDNSYGIYRSDKEIEKILEDKRERIKELEKELNQQTVTDKVIEDMKQRRKVGIKKYGEPLHTHNGRSALQDAYEEALDLAQYLKQKIMEENG